MQDEEENIGKKLNQEAKMEEVYKEAQRKTKFEAIYN